MGKRKGKRKFRFKVDETNLWTYFALILGVIFLAYIATGGFRNERSVFEEVSEDDDPYLGEDDAKIKMVSCEDYQCPFCKKFFEESLPLIKKDYIDKGLVKYTYRDFPLEFHEKADEAAIAANCAGEQGKYWEMHDEIFKNQESWSGIKHPNTVFKIFAEELKLDLFEFEKCIKDKIGKQREEVEKDRKECEFYNTTGTPTFYINGEQFVGAQPYEKFKEKFDLLLRR